MGASALQHASVRVALVYIHMLMMLLGLGTQVLHVKLDERLQQIFGEERLPLRRVSERLAMNSEKSST